MRRLSGLVLVSLVLVIGCRSAADSSAVLPAPAGTTAGEQFARLVDDAIDARFLEATIRGRFLDAETLETWRNPMIYAGLPGYAIGSLNKREFAPAHDRLVPVVSRLEEVPSIDAGGRQNIANPPKEFTDLAVRMAGRTAGCYNPTYLYDTLGKLEILDLREESMKRKGGDAAPVPRCVRGAGGASHPAGARDPAARLKRR